MTLPSADSRSLIKQQDFLDRLGELSLAADRVRSLSEELIGKIQKRTDLDPYYRYLEDGPMLEVVCGRGLPKGHANKKLTLFWDTIRTLIAARFSGFSLGSRETKQSISNIRLTLSRPKKADAFAKKGDVLWTAPQNGSPFEFAKFFYLLSRFSAFKAREADLDATSQDKLRSSLEEATSRAKQCLNAFENDLRGNPPELLWPVSLLKLLESVTDAKLDEAKRQELDRLSTMLLERLTLSLRSGNMDASPFEMADTLAVLAGRYLNPRLQLAPADAAVFTDAVAFVLKSSSPRNGSWTSEYTVDRSLTPEKVKRLEDPLSRRYTPLAYLLELPNSVLMPCIGPLVETSEQILSALKRELDGFLVREEANPNAERITGTVYDGLLIGTAVADRIKDLLSDVELDALGATVPTDSVAWDQISDSLGLKSNLEDGVIKLWLEGHKERPGAILVFGPPGTGKTTIAKALLLRLNSELRQRNRTLGHEWRFVALSPADFARDGADKVIASAERLFRRLQRLRRCVVLLDEMEEFLRVRTPGSSPESRLITTAFLPLLQDTVNKREIILIVATNFVGTIDPAVTRRGRFDLILPLGPPYWRSREEIVNAALVWAGSTEFRATIVQEMTRLTVGYTRDEILDFVREFQLKYKASSTKRLLESVLWQIRQNRVPMALSGQPGCNWRTFRDEATRFKRAIVDETDKDDKYWDEPTLPEFP